MARSTSGSGTKKTAAKKAPAKKATTKSTAKKAPAKQAAAKKSAPAKKPSAKKAPATTTSAQKTTAQKMTAKQTTSQKSTSKKTATKDPAKKPSTTTTSTPAAPRSRTKAKTLAPKLVVREDESPWTKSELKGVRKELEGEVTRLRTEIEEAEQELVDLMRDHADGAGDDQADQGAKTFEREQEISLANNARAMLIQNLHALERLEDGSYGQCESCGNPIGKLRLQAYPRATLCVACKTKQERR